MARLEDLPEPNRAHILSLEMVTFDTQPWVSGPPLRERRIAVVSTAALGLRDDPPFLPGTSEFRAFPASLPSSELRMSHVSINYDRAGWQRDVNTIYPVERLGELAREGAIGSVADTHYALMGSTDPRDMAASADAIAARMRSEGVNGVLLCPV